MRNVKIRQIDEITRPRDKIEADNKNNGAH